MKLHYRASGEGPALIILHGLFGSGDNWNTLARAYVESGFKVYLADQRNHGRSPHDPQFSYEMMADDLQQLIKDEQIDRPFLLGHSMGGKTLMFHAARYPEVAPAMIIADISPRYYSPHHDAVIGALRQVNLDEISSRKEAEESLRSALRDEGTIQFLLKSLYWKDSGRLAWRFDLDSIEVNIANVGEALAADVRINIPVLFLRGDRSGYITSDDEVQIRRQFTDSEIKTISGAGHWLHADQPGAFLTETLTFLKAKKNLQ